MIKKRELFSFLPLINNSVTIGLSFLLNLHAVCLSLYLNDYGGVTRLGYNLQTRWKMRTRFCTSSSVCTIDFNFVRYVGVTFAFMKLSWWSRDLSTIYRPDRK